MSQEEILNPENFEMEQLYNLSSFQDITNPESMNSLIVKTNNFIGKNPHIAHGIRIENMFGYIASMLGGCCFIKKEDAGARFSKIEMIPPDYRLILNNGKKIFVEVKNCNKQRGSFFISKSYLNKLLRYPEVSKDNLKIAIFWSVWKIWTLVSIDSLEIRNKKFSISFTEAAKKNEMGLLNDYMFGGYAPIKLEFVCDTSQVKEINNSGIGEFKIKEVIVSTRRGLVEEEKMKNILFDIIMYGLNSLWKEENEAILENNKIKKIIHTFSPSLEEGFADQNDLVIFDSMSRILVNKYNLMTVSKGKISKIFINFAESELYKVLVDSRDAEEHLPGIGKMYIF